MSAYSGEKPRAREDLYPLLVGGLPPQGTNGPDLWKYRAAPTLPLGPRIIPSVPTLLFSPPF